VAFCCEHILDVTQGANHEALPFDGILFGFYSCGIDETGCLEANLGVGCDRRGRRALLLCDFE
jgi:hypothetical protein